MQRPGKGKTQGGSRKDRDCYRDRLCEGLIPAAKQIFRKRHWLKQNRLAWELASARPLQSHCDGDGSADHGDELAGQPGGHGSAAGLQTGVSRGGRCRMRGGVAGGIDVDHGRRGDGA